MLPQAQDMLVSSSIPFDVPLGALLVLALLVVLASGVVFESGVVGRVRDWLSGGSARAHRMPRRVAPAGHRS